MCVEIITPKHIKGNLLEWIKDNRSCLEIAMHRNGGLLLRDFGLCGVSEFNQIAHLISPKLLEYTFQSTPRTRIGGKIYSSTEYPKDKTIALHSENAYSNKHPSVIMFFSVLVAASGGQTPIADNRLIYQRIPQTLRDHFEKNGVLYVRNFRSGTDLSWQQVFQTEKKEDVETYCHQHNIRFEWRGSEELRTEEICPAVREHPVTRERVWFNQAHLFHISNLPKNEQTLLIEQFGEDALPRNAYYGDGSAIQIHDLALIRDIYKQEKQMFYWKKGDVMILDNLLMCHGREPFTGDRKVVVAMG